ncbi:MAG: hypothetical protein JW715_03920 [Sedimentisphaerales bacterium]|nr:hypothetical protein [Sedimentisphaerales bacterium]
MLLPGFISKILAAFRGGVSPVIIFLSILLGFWFGMIPGFTGFHVVLIILILLINVPVGMVIFWGALGRALCYAAAPVLYHIGLWMQTNTPFVFRFLESLPIIGLTDFSTYSVAGGFILGPVVGVIVGLLMARSVLSFRRMLLKLEEGSETFRKWYSKTWVRMLDRILIGKRTKDAKSLFTKKTKYIRKVGAVLAVIVLIIALLAGMFIKDKTVKEYAINAMTRANGAEVNLDNIGISILQGSVSASGIQVTDPKNLSYNQVAIGEISADASVYNLFLGKVIMDKVKVSDIQFNQQRSTPGKPYESRVEEKPEVFEPNKYEFNLADIARLDKYFKDAKALKEKLQKLSKYLPSGEGEEKAAAEPEQSPQKYLEYLTAHALVPASPRFMAKIATLEKVRIPSAIFGNSTIELTNLSDSPKAAGKPITFKMDSLEKPANINATIDYSLEAPKLSGSFEAVDMSALQSSLSSDAGLVFKSGTASGKFEGTATKDTIDLTLNVDIQNLRAEGQGKGIFGMGSEATTTALSTFENLQTTIQIIGPITEPRLVFDKDLKDKLLAAAGQKIMKEVDKKKQEYIDELKKETPDELKGVIEKSDDVLKGIFGGKKEDK